MCEAVVVELGGNSVGRVCTGGRGELETSAGDGNDRPCRRVRTSLVLVVFLYHLTCEITVSGGYYYDLNNCPHQCGFIEGIQCQVCSFQKGLAVEQPVPDGIVVRDYEFTA